MNEDADMIKQCKNCNNALVRCNFSYSCNGWYGYAYECCLPENEKEPYRRLDDTCDKWKEKKEKC